MIIWFLLFYQSLPPDSSACSDSSALGGSRFLPLQNDGGHRALGNLQSRNTLSALKVPKSRNVRKVFSRSVPSYAPVSKGQTLEEFPAHGRAT